MIKRSINVLKELKACEEAINFVASHKIFQAAWDNAKRGDWMLWLLGKLAGPVGSDSRKRLLIAVCECARLALPYTKDPRVLKCIEVVEAYSKNEATLEDIKKARQTTNAAAYAAAYAAVAAAYAAAAANAAVYAAVAAADAADAAAYAAAAYAAVADAAAIRKDVLKQCADIVRKHYPKAPTL